MHWILAQFIEDIELTGHIPTDASVFLAYHDCLETHEHCKRVAAEARQLAVRFGVDESLAEAAGWLHDISAVFRPGQRCEVAQQLSLEILPEERTFPAILHQKLSRVMAKEIFGITDESVLSAIECHTTLRADASALGKIVFIADKIQWGQAHQQPFLRDVQDALDRSLDEAVFCYIDYLWQRRHTLSVIHPWLAAAYRQLSAMRTLQNKK